MNRYFKLSAPLGEIVSPRGLVARAAILSAIFAICHFAGLREFTGILCGTYPSTTAPMLAAGLGFVYIIMYLAFTVVVPVLLIAAALLSACHKLFGSGE